ncbi:uncharacterized protein LOC111040889 isoform X2 [Myzus persicae]|uniref:uncharacterized protein LOC111040889 isoform X2 n=1 Tax=Myzus persicae TaxID=13164 RepID=UPI000B930372|nr:uncharacterized protein LOC111040889 isoform X2 [Myzus persicae]
MDKYVKRIKRKEDNGGDDTDVDKFYVPGGQLMAADSAVSCALGIQQPAAPQKSDRPATPPSPILSMSPTSEDLSLSKKTIGQMKRIYVSRRLLFDDEEKVNINKPVSQHLIVNSQPTDVLEEKTSGDDACQTIINSLSARGFVVNNHNPCNDCGGSLGQYGFYKLAGTDMQTTDMIREGGEVLTSLSSVCNQFECLSVFEGIIYTVHVAAAGLAGDKSIETAKVLATVGPHPHIVSYFCNWMDTRYHFMQTEQCQASLSSLRMNNIADCRMVLEHISCALHYLHDGKMYAHNRVSLQNIYSVLDGDRVIYKLGGFGAATKLIPDGSATVADVQSLCLMVSELIKNGDGWSADEEDLRHYLSNMAGTVNPATVNALSVWRWCCDARHRPPLMQSRQTGLSDIVYRNIGTSNVDRGDAADQTAILSSLRKIKLPWLFGRASDNE